MVSQQPDDDSDEAAPDHQFPRPPQSFTDDEKREIEIRVYDGEMDELVEMYQHLDPADRAQGIPPRSESRCESWLETLIEEGKNLVAWHGDSAVGHSVLIPMEEAKWELAIFVRSDYQKAHIGSSLIRCLLGYGQQKGAERVWLSVEQRNTIAVSLYRSVGFERVSEEPEFHMERAL